MEEVKCEVCGRSLENYCTANVCEVCCREDKCPRVLKCIVKASWHLSSSKIPSSADFVKRMADIITKNPEILHINIWGYDRAGKSYCAVRLAEELKKMKIGTRISYYDIRIGYERRDLSSEEVTREIYILEDPCQTCHFSDSIFVRVNNLWKKVTYQLYRKNYAEEKEYFEPFLFDLENEEWKKFILERNTFLRERIKRK